jgi:hypothetical protein
VAAACVALLSPQVFRMTGHYALAYACFIPMLWFYAMAWLQEKKWIRLLGLLSTLILFGGLHAYYLALGAAFLLPASFIYFFSGMKEKKRWIYALLLALVALLPMILYQVWLSATGALELSDRHPKPWGFFHYHANFSSIFLPHQGWVKDLLSKFITLKANEFEGVSFVGSAAILAWVAGIITFRKTMYKAGTFPPVALHFFGASVLCLLVSMSFPFNAIPSAWIPGPVWQFRSLGRFAWAFYYVFAGLGVWWLYLLAESFRKRGQAAVAMGLVVILLIFWLSEGLSAQKQVSTFIKEYGHHADDFLSSKNNYADRLRAAGRKPSDFQAIMSFPYFSIGSEEIYIERGGIGLYQACKASLALHLPVAQTFLGRTSISQTLHLVQLMSHPLIAKDILKDLPDQRPFLLITSYEDLKPDERRIVESANLITRVDGIAFYEVPLSVFRQSANASQLKPNDQGYFVKGKVTDEWQLWIKDSSTKAIWKADFEEQEISEGNGFVLSVQRKDLPDGELEISLWLKVLAREAAFPVLCVEQRDGKNQLLQENYCNPKEVTDVWDGQVRASVLVTPLPEMRSLEIWLRGKEQACSRLLIRNSGNDVWASKRGSNEISLNNYPLSGP